MIAAGLCVLAVYFLVLAGAGLAWYALTGETVWQDGERAWAALHSRYSKMA
jgi:hypothetical protein